MDVDQLHVNITNLGHCGIVLSTEERANIVCSLDVQKLKGGFNRLCFWGVIHGTIGRYYVAQGFQDDPLDKRTSMYSTDALKWGLLPPATDEILASTRLVRGRFTGDPSFILDYVIRSSNPKFTENEDEPKALKKTISLKEEERLAATVAIIDNDAAVVPRGHYIKSPKGLVSVNRTWTGLSPGEAMNPSHYLHFRNDFGSNDRKSPYNVPAVDFMQSIDGDSEALSWIIQPYRGSSLITLKNLYWEGYCFYLLPHSRQFGGLYFGLGEANLDLPFMI